MSVVGLVLAVPAVGPTLSQLPLLVTAEAVKDIGAPEFVRVMICVAGPAPGWVHRLIAAGDALSSGVELEVIDKVTEIVRGELPAVELETLTVPVYVPTPSPPLLTPTDTVPGVVPMAGTTVSQGPPLAVVADAEKLRRGVPLVI